MAITRLTPGRALNYPVVRGISETVATNAPSSDVLIPYGARPTVRLIGFASPGRAVQYSTSPEQMIWAGTAVWANWPNGVIIGDSIARATGAITGLRLATTGGAGTWEVVS